MPTFRRLADFFYECGMLRHTPRSGFAFLGSGSESVAEHTCRVAMIGFALASMSGADVPKVVTMCLFHDLHEARTSDFNYVNHRYDSCRARDALVDCTRDTGLEQRILQSWDEFEECDSRESALARDADQLDLICNLAVEKKRGNASADGWIHSALKRLRTAIARDMADAIINTDPDNWWYGDVPEEWWAFRK